MKKIILTSLVASITILSANSCKYYFTPTFGKIIHEGSNLNEEITYGYKVGIPIEKKYGLDTFEFAHEKQKNVNYENTSNTTKVNRFSGNLLKHYDSINAFTPYSLVGIGYESFSNKILDTKDGLFANAGIGLKYKLNDYISFMADARHLINLNGHDNHTILNAGLIISCSSAKKTYPQIQLNHDSDATIQIQSQNTTQILTVYNETILKDTDKDGVVDELDKCLDSKVGDKVDGSGCVIEASLNKEVVTVRKNEISNPLLPVTIVQPEVLLQTKSNTSFENNTHETSKIIHIVDTDKDGINDELDKCHSTPTGFDVDSNGCELIKNLVIHFDTNDKLIKDIYKEDLENFVNFVKAFPGYKINIIGHTDNEGTKKNNLKLSFMRANSLKDFLLNLGVQNSRITTIGYGEEKPLVSNSTERYKEENRRVEVNLLK